MDYQRHYNLLIEKARNRLLDGYSETHHIIPKCMGGLNIANNLVELTPEEHFTAHQLLIKIYPDQSKLVMAARYMCGEITSNTGRQNNKLFGWLRKRHAEAMRKINTGRKDSDETKKRKSDALKNKTKTKEHIQKVTDALRGRKANPGSSEKRTATRMKNGSYVVSKSSRELRRQNRAMQADIHNVKICMFGINYISIKEARETLKVGRTYIINRLKSDKFPDCYYL